MSQWILLAFLFVISLSLYYLHKIVWVPLQIQNHFRKQGVNGPDYRPIFGNTAEIRRRLIAAAEAVPISGITHDICHRIIPHYWNWSSLYGRDFLYWFGPKPRLAVGDTKMIKEILMNNRGNFQKMKFNPSSKLLFGDGLVGLEGEKWAVHRRITAQAFNMERVKVIFSFSLYTPTPLTLSRSRLTFESDLLFHLHLRLRVAFFIGLKDN